MLCTSLLTIAAALPQGGQGSSSAPVVINEFVYDDSGTDEFEFVELYNRSTTPVDLSNWSLVGDDSNGVNFTETFPAGTILNPGDYLVIGDGPNVPNVDIIRASSFLQNSNESITIFDASQNIVDTLIYESNKGVFNTTLAEGEGIWCNFTCIEGNESSLSRLRDGYDTDNNGHDFRLQPWTPGTSNDLPYTSTVVEVFDAYTNGSSVPGWGSSWFNPLAVDPSVVDTNNPNAIPSSPQGGNVGVLWDPAGGGDHGMLLADPGRSSSFEAYVYIPSAVTPVGEQEMWTVGFGTSGTYYNLPDPTTALGFTANGNTGIGWTFVRDELGANIYLIDHNDGGVGGNAITDATVIGTIAITAGVNDGWQRLRLEVASGVVIANFGGTYGVSDGTVFTGAIADVDRGLYVSYREALTALSDARPLTWDLMTYTTQGSARATAYGVGCDNLSLTTSGSPTLGNAAFSLDVNNVGAIPIAFVAFGSAATNPGLDLTGIGMPGCFGYTSLDLGLYPTGPSIGGTSSMALPIPNSVTFIGSQFAAQGVGFTPVNSLGLSASNGIQLFLGL
jgi:hypothetical protein